MRTMISNKDTYTLASGKKLTFKFFAHASFMIDYDGIVIYSDPIGEYADYDKEPKADIILVTHDHYDHLDRHAIEKILKDDTCIITNKVSALQLEDLHPQILDYYQQTEIKSVKIKVFQAYNTTPGRDKFHPKGRDNAYLLTIENVRVYISGDTEIIEDNDEINGCDFLFMAVNQPYTMTIDQAEKFAQRIKPKIFYPYHTTDTDMEALQQRFSKFGFQTIVYNMQ